MKFVHTAAAMALAIGATLLGTSPASARSKLTGEARVAEIVAGRTPGRATFCINPRDIRSTELIADVGVAYFMRNGAILINRPDAGPFITGFDDIMVTTSYTGQLCRLDIVQLVDRNTQFGRGSFSLGDFVPYARPPRTDKR